MTEVYQNIYRSKKYCPNHINPCDNCYCVTLNSQDIEKAIYYCTSNYTTCPIYRSDICKRSAAPSASFYN